ncbi:FAD-dependent oxidoreductase [Phytoactinopolyspora endophytica]|uniref:FAD-dependent oxidoreductase n=1 Tax=Phytoactinopolyspora endophytica TaxID=1642495 RepID=UPI00101DE457|nr:FAD-dependent oxidoreductase [Phytoactinopolyspora endophytica]
MREESVNADVVVVGGGLAGVCAAIAAARLGRSVALINSRPVLGGNSSSEVRVWICGATANGRQRFARENGIIGEMLVENQYRNPEGNPYYWDLVVLEAVRAEPGIQLFLNTDVRSVQADGPDDARIVESVTGWMTGSERSIEFRAPVFLDCTGDGLVGHLAGARYRVGRESSDEYGEPWAPEVADSKTLGSTMLFYSKDIGRPVKYVPPSFAVDISTTSIPERRIISTERDGCYNWWIEWGGELDSVHDNERIRDELWGVIYGIWDYIKNSGQFDADTLTLEWVASIPGKREYRRFVGDYTLTQNDILVQADFDDRVAFGGWSIDLHPVGGVYANEAGSKHWLPDGNYHIPLRSLYSSNVSNLLFAGRDISASHVAFGTTRVMATCAATGEAAGSAAALCVANDVAPRELHARHLRELQLTMLRQDAPILGMAYEDPADHALTATVTASSTLTDLAVDTAGRRQALDADIGAIVPVDPRLDGIDVLVDAAADTELSVTVYSTGRAQNYVPAEPVAKASVPVPAGQGQWVTLPVSWEPEPARNAFVVIERNTQVSLAMADDFPGVIGFERIELPGDLGYPQPLREWRVIPRQAPCLRVRVTTSAFRPENVIGGYARPFGGPQMWVSEPIRPGRAEWVRLSWPAPVEVGEIQVIFDDDVNEDLNNLHRTHTPFDVIPALVKDYRIEALADGEWITVAQERDNRRRRRVHRLDGPVHAESVRVVVESTNGSERAHVVAIRVYDV